MIDIDSILLMWSEDSAIDEHSLDDTTIKGARLHSKYLDLYTKTKIHIKKTDMELNTLLKSKWEWYNGKMPKNQIDSLGWAYDPFDGCSKPLKGYMDRYYNADPDIQKVKAKLDLLNIQKETLDEIISTLRWRHQNIKNIISWRQFLSGN